MQVFIERARRIAYGIGYINLYFSGSNYLEYKYPNSLMHCDRARPRRRRGSALTKAGSPPHPSICFFSSADLLGTKPQRCFFPTSYVINRTKESDPEKEKRMLKWAAIFLVIAIIAAIFGFTGIAGAAADIARFLFFLFIAIFVVIFLLALFAGKKMF